MAKCMQCGGMSKAAKMKKGGVKKMKAGGSTDVNISKPGAGFAKPQRGGDDQKYFIYGMPTAGIGETDGKNGKMKKGGAVKKMAKGGSTFGMLSVKAGVDNNPNPTAADRIAGATKKAKFGATVKVQRSPKAGKVRSAGDQGYAAVGKREPGRIIKKVISKKK
jgi:hypothetical protein